MTTLTFNIYCYDYLLYNKIPSFALEMNVHLRMQQNSPFKLVKHIGGLRVLKNLDRKLTFVTTQKIDK